MREKMKEQIWFVWTCPLCGRQVRELHYQGDKMQDQTCHCNKEPK